MPRKTRSTEPAAAKPLKTYFTLREAFDFVGESLYAPKWQGFEADCDPARAAQSTDGETLLKVQGPDGRVIKRLPVPKRPIDGDDGAKLEQAIERHVKALKGLLRFLHSGDPLANFIAENETTQKDPITASKWPDPAEFDPKNPTWVNLWFDITADRVVLKSAGTSPIPGRAQREGSLWWAYGGRSGRVEIDRETLEKTLKQYVRSKKSEDSTAETTARNTKIQQAAEAIWQEASKEGYRLTKEEVANRLLARSDAVTLCRDLKNQDGGVLSQDSLVRLIAVPKWLSKRSSRRKDNQSSATQDNNTL